MRFFLCGAAMTDIQQLIEMQEGRRKRPLVCRFGLHRMFQAQQFITTGYAVCASCGCVWMTSLFGDFDCTKRESINFLHRLATAESGDAQPLSQGHSHD